MYCFSQEQVAPLGSPDHFRRPVCHSCGTQLLPHCLHSSSQRKLRPPADLSGEDREGYLQVHGHLHHGVPSLHDWDVQPLLLLPWCKVQPRLYNVSTRGREAAPQRPSPSGLLLMQSLLRCLLLQLCRKITPRFWQGNLFHSLQPWQPAPGLSVGKEQFRSGYFWKSKQQIREMFCEMFSSMFQEKQWRS